MEKTLKIYKKHVLKTFIYKKHRKCYYIYGKTGCR